MIRRLFKKAKTYKPDTHHLHQLIYKFILKNFKIKNKLIGHIITSSSINLFNLITILIAANFIYDSAILLFILLVNILFYFLIFSFLKKN
tara:strand:- start:223 stop:492 length:270 start_codon:yes stop_codon:yes gene_type:complete